MTTNTAWWRGYYAYCFGADMAANPYVAGSPNWEHWRDGWMAAADDAATDDPHESQ